MSEKKSKKQKVEVEEGTADVDMDAPSAVNIFANALLPCTHVQQSPKKSKKERADVVISIEDLSPLAKPLAQKKLLKKLNKTIKKGAR